MVVALVVIAVILVGFPLLAWWFGNRRFWRKLRPSPTPVHRDELRRRFGLSVAEMSEARQAAHGGRALTDPALRAAVVAVAEQTLERQRAYLIVGRAAAVAGVAALVAGIVLGEFRSGTPVLTSVVWLIIVLNLLVQAGTSALVVRRLRRAIALNRAPVPEDRP